MTAREKIYFLSDLHLKLDNKPGTAEAKKPLLKFLSSVPDDAKEIVLMGDIFDFWYEWIHVVPSYHFDIFFSIKKLIERGIKVTYLAGNHDFKLGRYLKEEIGINCVENEYIFGSRGKRFFAAHGDGLARSDGGYRLLKKILRSKIDNFLFRTIIHPDLGIWIANATSKSSRKYRKIDRIKWSEEYSAFAQSKLKEGFDYVIMGHLHLPQTKYFGTGMYLNTGDWIEYFSYGLFDGEKLTLESFNDGR
ncbi:MAG TPA: UDP-2,3-diacylglucosamine diphosphatase [Clostridiales bacterium]|nr:UDP-2,3-diacylglucosamine diphosphatase [Clostridiales bacterium]HQP70641.1 UDP-2,3-diacylglucosamine diphosphatase [Clostridiales bacterium]